MTPLLANSTLSLSNLLGLRVTDSPCVLNAEQFARLGALLLANRPQDGRAICFIGGVLSNLADSRRGPEQNVVSLQSDLGNDPFLVVAGPQGALALLAVESPRGFRTRIYTDLDTVDRAALVVAQFGDHPYSLDAMSDNETQRGFVAGLIATAIGDSAMASVDLSGLFMNEARWVELGRALAGLGSAAGLFGLPTVRRLLQDLGLAKTLLGQLDADQQHLSTIAAEGGNAPARMSTQSPLIGGALRAQRIASATPIDTAAIAGEEGRWVGGQALTVVPLVRVSRPWGALLATSERALSANARAGLSGLGALIDVTLIAAAPAVPVLPSVPPSAALRPPVAPVWSPVASGASAASRPPAAPVPPAPPAPSGPPASARPSAGGSLARRAQSVARSVNLGDDLLALIGKLNDAVLIVDSYGRIVAVTAMALEVLSLTHEVQGRSLVESGAWCLAPLLTEAIMGDVSGPQTIELPNGRSAQAHATELSGGMWAFVIHTEPAAVPSLSVTSTPAPTLAVKSERNESFLSNFSNIIHVPLRELRSLITQVPAAGNLNEQQLQLIGQVVKLNSELTMLVNDLLALGQIRLQSSEHRVPLRLDLLIEAAVGTQYAEFGRRGQHMTTEIEPGLPRVQASEEGLGRAVAALIDNAIKYSPVGAQITVAASHKAREVLVSVQDNGPGLLPEELTQVFDPFFRAPSIERLGVAGRGLGLTITKAVIEQHGGRVWVEAAPNRGARFSFSLPCE